MPHRIFLVVLTTVGVFIATSACFAPPAKSAAAPPEQPVVIPFDFQSEFDEGRYGRMVGDLIWKRLDRRGGVVLPESMLDVRDWCDGRKKIPGPDTPLAEMNKIVREEWDGNVGIWGKVERVAGSDGDVYDVWIRIADFSGSRPRVIYKKKARTKTVSQIPHLLVKEALDHLYGTLPTTVSQADPAGEPRWKNGPNLIQGDFERGTSAPAGWDRLPRFVSLRTLDAESGSKNRFLRFELSEKIAATTGLLIYSEYFPIEEGATYRFQCRWRSTGPKCKVFIKCYDAMESKYGNRGKRTSYRNDREDPDRSWREVYRSQQNLTSPRADSYELSETSLRDVPGARRGASGEIAATWHLHTEQFTPRHKQFTPRRGRVMLYAYGAPGIVDWDDIVARQIASP
jgi:hypothetical protein